MWPGKKIMYMITVWSFRVVFTGVFPNIYLWSRVLTAGCQYLLLTLREVVTGLWDQLSI